MIRIYFLVAVLLLFIIILHHIKVIERNMRNKTQDELDLESDNGFDIASTMVEEKTLEDYQLNLQSNIAYLRKLVKDIGDKETKDITNKVIALLGQIYNNTDENEYNKGNLKKLNSYYNATFIKLLVKYKDLEQIEDSGLLEVIKAKKDMIAELPKFVTVYQNLLKESISSDLADMSVEMNVFNQLAVQNGVLDSTNVLKSNK